MLRVQMRSLRVEAAAATEATAAVVAMEVSVTEAVEEAVEEAGCSTGAAEVATLPCAPCR